jgi:uncharacterized membrane protein YhhN
MQVREKTLLLVFALASLGNLIATLIPSATLNFVTKPLLLLSLLVAWLSIKQGAARFTWLIAGAFFFSWLGDLLLMLVNLAPDVPFFILGLGSFLVAHLFFSAAFWYWKAARKGSLQTQPLFFFPFLLLWSLLIYLLWPGLGALRIPVLMYSLVIIVMTASAHNLWNVLAAPYRGYLSAGTLLFVLSDSLIALNKFKAPLMLASFWIMLTYILAQYLLYRGLKGMRDTAPI